MKSKTVIEMGRGGCKPGDVRRKGYTRSDGTRVKASCVVDQGKRGKTPKSERVLPKPKAGKLMGWKTKLSAAERHAILRQVARKHGCKDAVLDLNLLANYTKRTSPKTHRTARADMAWLRKQDWCGYTQGGKRKK